MARGIRALLRSACCVVVTSAAFDLAGGPLLGQGSTGKIQGHIRDQSGAPVASAEVAIVGSAFITTADPRGYYFINNVPAGVYDLKASFIGYKALEVTGLRVIQGQTMTQDVVLELAPLQIEDVTVIAATNPLVPRDQVTTKQIVSGDFVKQLPVNQINEVLTLQPGILPSTTPGNLTGIQVRGGRGDETATYIDGVPVSPGFRGTGGFGIGTLFSELTVGVNGFEDASVTTGAYSAEFGNAQSGILNIATRSGGPKFNGDVRVESDAMWSSTTSVGYSQVELGLGGPIVKGLTFNLTGVIAGNTATSGGFDSQNYPVFVTAGVDSVLKVPTVVGRMGVDTNVVIFPNFAAYRGDCSLFTNSPNAGIRENYGISCQGTRNPNTQNSNYQVQGKLSYGYGTGSRISVTGLGTQNQGPVLAGDSVNPLSYLTTVGSTVQSQAVIATWFQNLSKRPDRALSLNVSLSLQRDQRATGNITAASERSLREPFGGFMFKRYDFLWDFDNVKVTDQMIDAFIGGQLPPLLEPGTPYSAGLNYRIDPYGRNGSLAGISVDAYGSAPNSRVRLIQEERAVGSATLDWQVNPYNRIKFGGEYTAYGLSQFFSLPSPTDFGDISKGNPYRAAAFGEEILDLGDVVLKAGVRWDTYSSNTSRPWLPYDSTRHIGGYPYPDPSKSPGFDSAYAATGNAKVFYEADQAHSYVSPHVQVSFPVTQNTNFRLSYAHQAQAPDWGIVYLGINGSGGGSDLGFAKTILFEFGVRQSFGPDMVLDVSLYDKTKQSDVSMRTVTRLNADSVAKDLSEATNLDFGDVRGIDVRLDRRFGAWFNGTLGYTFQQARSTGSDPYSYFNFFSRLASGVPPQAVITTNDSRPHQLSGSLALTVPSDWKRGSATGAILRNVGAYFTFRFASGLPWTSCPNDASNKDVFTTDINTHGACAKGLGSTSVNGNRLPMWKNVNLRLTKGFNLGRSLDLTAYADFRNLFNWRVVNSVFSANGDIQNPIKFSQDLKNDSTEFYNEVAYNQSSQGGNIYDPATGSVNLTNANTCLDWSTTSNTGGLPNCFGIYRAEERWGNGDHILTVAEYSHIFATYYNVTNGPGNFTDAPRRIVLGLELTF